MLLLSILQPSVDGLEKLPLMEHFPIVTWKLPLSRYLLLLHRLWCLDRNYVQGSLQHRIAGSQIKSCNFPSQPWFLSCTFTIIFPVIRSGNHIAAAITIAQVHMPEQKSQLVVDDDDEDDDDDDDDDWSLL
ncbi:hypothetical protein OPV22_007641 [Ensete ventricosum]|uniref:Uncharacterized protein n=1 Tax=Ensete ventricosum TaxID=4639 RepID=A0AAV8RHQ1_ENSVE|nr:hypothetical protein OPV22_007641 [Ensete ventricosum]